MIAPDAATPSNASDKRAFTSPNTAATTGRALHVASLIPPPSAVNASSNIPAQPIRAAASSPLRYRLCSAATAPTTRTLPPAKAARRRAGSRSRRDWGARSRAGNSCVAALERVKSRQSVTAVSALADPSVPDTSPPSISAKPSGTRHYAHQRITVHLYSKHWTKLTSLRDAAGPGPGFACKPRRTQHRFQLQLKLMPEACELLSPITGQLHLVAPSFRRPARGTRCA
ncbi:Uncharacterised protein [Mycobacteroides abscessus subsp. massiliense]|nr:Uncharacterised protein [Mycobacteroides abscessus subsp. massiliense]